MQLERFSSLLQHPENINSEDTEDLKEILLKYPYFQSARALYLKSLKNSNSFRYNQELKVTATYTTDRSILFDFITSEAFKQNSISDQIKENSIYLKELEIKTQDLSTIQDHSILEHVNSTTEKDIDPVIPTAETESTQTEESENKAETKVTEDLIKLEPEKTSTILSVEAIEQELEIGLPLDFNASETHSFSEWLKLAAAAPIVREASAELKTTEQISPVKIDKAEIEQSSSDVITDPEIKKKFKLIDQFLVANPKIKPSKESVSINIPKAQSPSNDGLMTETLARIYLEQKNYDKAMQSYRILSLKYPEKSGFFADRIRAIKQLQEKNNT